MSVVRCSTEPTGIGDPAVRTHDQGCSSLGTETVIPSWGKARVSRPRRARGIPGREVAFLSDAGLQEGGARPSTSGSRNAPVLSFVDRVALS